MRVASHVSLPAVRPPPAPLHGGPLTLLRFIAKHGMLTPKYVWLIALLLRRKFLSTYGRRLKLDGLAFIPRERWPWTVVTQIMTPWRRAPRPG